MADNLSTLEEGLTVPASEIIHDRMNCLFHPLVGISPIFACGLAAMAGKCHPEQLGALLPERLEAWWCADGARRHRRRHRQAAQGALGRQLLRGQRRQGGGPR